MNTIEHRYHLEGNSIFFHDVNIVLYKNFWFRYRSMTIPQARRKMKKWWGRKAQDEIIHFLKTQNRIIQS